MLLHINPTRQRGRRTGSLARASGWYMTFFAAGVISWVALVALIAPARGRASKEITNTMHTGTAFFCGSQSGRG